MRLSINNHLIQLIIFISALFLLQSCGEDNSPTRVTYNPPAPYEISEADSSIITEEGLEVHIIDEGYGFKVTGRDQISTYYTGRTIENGNIGRVFDSTYRNESTSPGVLRNLTTSSITNSQGRTVSPLIEGFRLGIIGKTVGEETVIPAMQEGEKRVIIIPPSLGYGDAQEGTNGYDLRNDTLRFDIELESIF